jgi:hypothetical protein
MRHLLDALGSHGFKAFGVAYPTGQAYLSISGDPIRVIGLLAILTERLTPALADADGEEG